MAVTAPISWSGVKSALKSWFAGVTGLKTIWADGGGPRPAYPYGVLKVISPPSEEGGADEIRKSLGVTEGSEVEYRLVGNRLITVSCQVLTNAKTDGNDPDLHAMHYLSIAQASLALPSARKTLVDGRLAVVQQGSITDLTGVVDADFITRGALDVIFRIPVDILPAAAQSDGYVETVSVSTVIETALDWDGEVMGDT